MSLRRSSSVNGLSVGKVVFGAPALSTFGASACRPARRPQGRRAAADGTAMRRERPDCPRIPACACGEKLFSTEKAKRSTESTEALRFAAGNHRAARRSPSNKRVLAQSTSGPILSRTKSNRSDPLKPPQASKPDLLRGLRALFASSGLKFRSSHGQKRCGIAATAPDARTAVRTDPKPANPIRSVASVALFASSVLKFRSSNGQKRCGIAAIMPVVGSLSGVWKTAEQHVQLVVEKIVQRERIVGRESRVWSPCP